jgi:phage gp36-like protein
MKYITTEELESILSDRSLMALAGKDGLTDQELLDKVNKDAAAEIDGYLRGIYPLPLAIPVDPLLSTICGDLMKFRLYKRRDEKAMPENVLAMYKLAVSKLKDIQLRTIVLDVPVPEGEPAPGLGTVKYNTPTQKFGNHFTGFDGL